MMSIDHYDDRKPCMDHGDCIPSPGLGLANENIQQGLYVQCVFLVTRALPCTSASARTLFSQSSACKDGPSWLKNKCQLQPIIQQHVTSLFHLCTSQYNYSSSSLFPYSWAMTIDTISWYGTKCGNQVSSMIQHKALPTSPTVPRLTWAHRDQLSSLYLLISHSLFLPSTLPLFPIFPLLDMS